MNKRLFCDGWEFFKAPLDEAYSENAAFQPISIPHDWLIWDVNNLYESSTGWYRKSFTYEKKEATKVFLRFDGVYMESTIYVNGQKAGEWKYGYSAFQFDITALLVDGENQILVEVRYAAPNSRWYSGAGIYRKVWLLEGAEVHFGDHGVYVHNSLENGQWTTCVESEVVRPRGMGLAAMTIAQTILDAEGNILAQLESDACAADASCIPEGARVDNVSYAVTTQKLCVGQVLLWDIENPYMYTLVSELKIDGQVVDTMTQTYGYRTICFTTNQGFFLNGRHVKLHGACEHHDLGCLGAAFHKTAMKRKMENLRRMGINAIRTSHNMPAEELMDLADEMGMLIMSEGFDMWEKPKTENDYARFFDSWIEKDVASWVRRDRNRPSIIGWSIGNEIFDQHADERGQEVTAKLKRLVELHDPKGNGFVTFGSNFMQWENGQKCGDIVKLVGYNYGERLYQEHHKKHPDWMMYGSETASVVQSRGIYHFPLATTVLADEDEQCSSIGNSCTGWGAKNTEDCIIKDRDAEFIAGQFIWTGFDYIGEPTPYSTKNSYFGQIDTAGFWKDSAYVFRAEWTDYKESPFVHIFPYWDFNVGQPIDVRVCSNAPIVELFFNGKSFGEFPIDHVHGTKLTADYMIPYEAGELKAVAYNEKHEIIAEDIQRTFQDASQISLKPDKLQLLANSEDLIFVEMEAVDSSGNFVANANNRINVEVQGAAKLVGLDNGDSTDYDQYKGTSRRLFSGKLLAVLASNGETGDIVVKVSSPNLPDSCLSLEAVEAPQIDGAAYLEGVVFAPTECGRTDETPIRKIELQADAICFTEATREILVKPVFYPAGTEYAHELEYKVTNETGIPTKMAELTIHEDQSVTVRAKGDGSFILRATCKNGTDKCHLISTLVFTAEGLGSALMNPYEFIPGGLYSKGSDNIASGISQGVGFATGMVSSWAAFENVDFGSAGADTITASIWANTLDPVTISFYDGIPGQGGAYLGTYDYYKQPEWMVFKDETFVLPRKLKGVHTFTIETVHGFQVAGFKFEKVEREYTKNYAADADQIYGDSFAVGEEAVTGIGNNVLLDFGSFDFTGKAPTQVVICGKSPLPLNSIHLVTTGKGSDEQGRTLLEFKAEPDDTYKELCFDIGALEGEQNISFLFLPGSNFDFKYFYFQ